MYTSAIHWGSRIKILFELLTQRLPACLKWYLGLNGTLFLFSFSFCYLEGQEVTWKITIKTNIKNNCIKIGQCFSNGGTCTPRRGTQRNYRGYLRENGIWKHLFYCCWMIRHWQMYVNMLLSSALNTIILTSTTVTE